MLVLGLLIIDRIKKEGIPCLDGIPSFLYIMINQFNSIFLSNIAVVMTSQLVFNINICVNIDIRKTIVIGEKYMSNKWIIEPGSIHGKNEAGIEMFKKGGDGAIAALIREDIQNSLDAIKDRTKPVKIVVDAKYISEIPGQQELSDVYNQIKSSSYWGHSYDQDIKHIQDILHDSKISVLKVSDFNTEGAAGASSYKKFGNSTHWTALTEVNGQTIKDNANSAGSFGIGKNANMAVTPLRTIFFTSKVDTDKIPYSQGKMTYASIVDPGKKTSSGNDFLYKTSNELPIPGELREFGNFNKRTESGTDLFIPGIDLYDDIYKDIKNAVLNNFLVSIYKGILEVEIISDKGNKQLINKNTLSNIVESLDSKDTLVSYYEALVQENSRYIFEMPSLLNKKGDPIVNAGDIKFYVYQSDDVKGTRKAMMTRGIGMKINNYPEKGGNAFPKGIDFTAVLTVTGDVPNELLHKIENPEHTSWNNKDKFKETPDARILFSELKKFMRSSIEQLLPEATDEIEAYGLEDFLTDDKLENQIKKEDKLPRGISNIKIKKTNKPISLKGAAGTTGSKGNRVGRSIPTNPGNKKSDPGKNGLQRKSRDVGGEGKDSIDVTSYIDSLRSKHFGKEYTVSLKANKDIYKPTLVFEIVGDSSVDTTMRISNINFKNKNYQVHIEGNEIKLSGEQDSFTANENIEMTFDTNMEEEAAFNVKILGKRTKPNEN